MTVQTADYTYREMLDMLDFLEEYEFDASEATERQWRRIIREALAAGWQR